jgi:uncharacterized protein YcnI
MSVMPAPVQVVSRTRWSVVVLLAAVWSASLSAQVSMAPGSVEPAGFERFALRVANPDSVPVIRVRLGIPEVLTVLGVDAPPGWSWTLAAATDTSAAAIEWTGDALPQGAFREFAVFARLASDARELTLAFPVRLERADGSTVTWTRGGDAPPLTVGIRATTGVSTRGAVVLAGGALGLAALALALAVFRRAR